MKKIISLITFFSFFLVAVDVEAAVPGTWAAFNVPPMTLAVRISAVQTTGITVNPPVRNGDNVSVPFTASGGVVELKQPGKVEHIYFSRATVNATTKQWTMTGTVVRDIPWNSATSFVTGGDGQIFTPGATVTFVDDARMFNLSVYTDRHNTFTAGGAIKFSGSGSFSLPSFATTAERDRQNPCTVASGALKAYVTATGLEYLCSGGVYVQASSGATSNAGYGNSGKVQLGRPDQVTAATGTGSSGAPLVLPVKDIVTQSNGTADAGKVAALSGSGLFDDSFIPTTTYGNGSDGALSVTSGQTAIDCGGAGYCTKNYTSISISAGATLSITNGSSSGTILILKSQGNVTIAGTINLTGSGGVGGAARTTDATVQNGLNASRITNAISRREQGIHGNGATGGGGGGANGVARGLNGAAGNSGAIGSGGIFYLTGSLLTNFAVTPGAGGGGGGSSDDPAGGTTTSSAGGRGGGGLYIGVGGNLVLTGTINLSGKNAPAGALSTGSYGGGGGGAAGTALIEVKGTLDYLSGTYTVTGGVGHAGAANDGGSAGAGGGGAWGAITITKSF